MTDAIKLKVLPRFPARLIGRAGIDVTKQGGDYYLDLDFADFPAIGGLPTGTTYALIFNPATGQYAQLPISLLGGSGGIPEAPTDGQLYGRKSSAWAVVPSGGGGGIAEAPNDGIAYARKNLGWSAVAIGAQAVVDTIAALKTVSKTLFTRAVVNGYYAAGDCRPRTYWCDTADTTSTDNGGSVIVASDGGRWKIVGQRVWTVKMFGATENPADGDMATIIGRAISAAFTARVPLEFDGLFSVGMLTVSSMSGMHWIGRGGLIGIASTAQDAILQLINVTDLTIDGRFVIDGNYNTNYSYGLHGFTNAAGQSVQYLNLSNIIFNACKSAWAFGSTSRPDDTISEINFFGGRTYGCPGIGIGIGKNSVVNTHGCTWQSEFGTSPGGWGSLPNTGLEARGATLNINGGELLYVLNTTGALTKITGLASATGNVYGNINVKDAVVECSNLLAATDSLGVSAPTGGSILFTGNRMVFTTDVLNGTIQCDNSFPGRITVVGNSGFSTVARTQWNINAVGNTSCIMTTDMQSFGVNCLQGYAGLNGGAQQIVVDGDNGAWANFVPTVTAQAGTIGSLGTCTARYLRRGKTILYEFDVTIATVGSGAQAIKVSLPFTARSDKPYVGTVYEYSVAGKAGTAAINPIVNDATNVYVRDYTGGTFIVANSKVTGQVEYEMP